MDENTPAVSEAGGMSESSNSHSSAVVPSDRVPSSDGLRKRPRLEVDPPAKKKTQKTGKL